MKFSFVDISDVFCVLMHVINIYDGFIGRFKADFENLFIAGAVNGKLNYTCSWHVRSNIDFQFSRINYW